MSSLFGLLGIARDGLNVQSAALNIAGQNVSNASTPGYVRRQAVIETLGSGNSSGGGVQVTGTTRSFDAFAFARVVDEQGKKGSADARSGALAQLEALIAPNGGSIGDRVNAFFNSVQALTATPSDPSARAGVLGAANTLAQTIASTGDGLAAMKQDFLSKAQGVAGEVNDRLSRIAILNGKIATAQANGDSAADLRDQRDTLLRDLGQRIGARGIEGKDGTVTVFAAGTALVDGDSASTISVTQDPSGQMQVQATRVGGAVVDVTANVTEGALGGLREARDTDLAKASSALDQFAYDLANAVNSVHSAGVGLDGVSGRPLFAPPAAVAGAARSFAVDPSVAGAPDHIAAAANANDLPGGNDAMLALAALGSASLAGGGPPAARFAGVAADVGVAKSSSDAEQQLRNETLTQASTLEQSASGVSIDEETVDITRYQRAYQAATKVLSTVDQLLDELMKGL